MRKQAQVRLLMLMVFGSVLLCSFLGAAGPAMSGEPPEARDAPKPAAVEVGDIEESDYSVFLEYLTRNAKPPAEYVIAKYKDHDVVIIGETHMVKENCELVSGLIEPLYREAGVTCLATEFLKSKYNDLANELVTAKEYDQQLALKLFRNYAWPTWGFKEYMDILKAVWQLNSSLPPQAQRVRVVGLDMDWDAYDDIVDPKRDQAYFFQRNLKREQHMTSVFKQGVRQNGGKALVHIGYEHTFTRLEPRFAHGLSKAYGDRLFQICLHKAMPGPRGRVRFVSFMEAIMKANGNKPIGFDVVGSPFANLRDKNSYYFSSPVHQGFSDIAKGYVFTKPLGDMSKVTWVEGFIDESNFERARAVALKGRWAKEGECETPLDLDSRMAQVFDGR